MNSQTVAAEYLHLVGAALAEHERGAIARMHIAAGPFSVYDDCCGGQLAVSVERTFKSKEPFPTESVIIDDPCWDGNIAVPLVIVLVRCVPTQAAGVRTGPTSDQLNEAYGKILDDADVIWNAVSDPAPDPGWERTAPVQTFTSGEGGCVGIETRITVGVPYEQWCV